jgi:hypothetical protein
MARPLAEYFDDVYASDIHDYGHEHGTLQDFLKVRTPFPDREQVGLEPYRAPDWIITNPPFSKALEFAQHALSIARNGVAFIVRSAFTESAARYSFFLKYPPRKVAQYVERVPMFRGKLERKGRSATAYCCVMWEVGYTGPTTEFVFIPPCKKRLDRTDDWPAYGQLKLLDG